MIRTSLLSAAFLYALAATADAQAPAAQVQSATRIVKTVPNFAAVTDAMMRARPSPKTG